MIQPKVYLKGPFESFTISKLVSIHFPYWVPIIYKAQYVLEQRDLCFRWEKSWVCGDIKGRQLYSILELGLSNQTHLGFNFHRTTH